MRILIAIATCHARLDRIDAQRKTWVRQVHGADVVFFVGGGTDTSVTTLDAPDGYDGLPAKVRAICRWAFDNGYDAMFKADDDTYIIPEMLLGICPIGQYDYVGNFRHATGGYPARYASGFGYWLSRAAVAAVMNAELTSDANEDRWVGNVVAANPELLRGDDQHHYRYIFKPATNRNPDFIFRTGSLITEVAAVAEFSPKNMGSCHKAHIAWKRSSPLGGVRKPRFRDMVVPCAA